MYHVNFKSVNRGKMHQLIHRTEPSNSWIWLHLFFIRFFASAYDQMGRFQDICMTSINPVFILYKSIKYFSLCLKEEVNAIECGRYFTFACGICTWFVNCCFWNFKYFHLFLSYRLSVTTPKMASNGSQTEERDRRACKKQMWMS